MNTSQMPSSRRPRRRRRLVATGAALVTAAALAVVPVAAPAAPAGKSYDGYDMAADMYSIYKVASGGDSSGCDDEFGCGTNHNEVMAST